MSTLKPLKIDIVSDVVCPWCYIGKRRIENALALVPDVPVQVRWRPFFLNAWVPREGIGRDEYLTAKFGSVEAYKGIAGRVVAAANEEGLNYRPELVKRQPNTIDCHRLIHWAEAAGKSGEMKQRLMELYFRDGGDLTDVNVLVQAAADIGLDAGEVRRRLATDADVALISGQAQEAAEMGISGVPTFVFAQKYAVSGAQPAEQLARAIRQVSGEINAQAAE
jgi:predicted DsbA family dithiol-disulfide isomerase